MMPSPPRARVVLLGASNLTRALSTVLGTSQAFVGSPLEVLGAMGLGRSYGIPSSVLLRRLTGIVDCGLWEALRRASPVPTFGLLTDVGNDIPYGVPVQTIVAWIEWCLDRLEEARARVVVTLLPMRSLELVSPFRYGVARRILFPTSMLTFGEAMARVRELNERLEALARRRGLPLPLLEPSWYGLDPIHIRMRHWPQAWGRILGAWRPEGDGAPPPLTAPSPGRWLSLQLLPPERWSFAGMALRRRQPAGRLPDGTTVALY